MKQNAIYDRLKEIRYSGDERYFSAKEIHQILNSEDYKLHSIRGWVRSLEKSGHIESDSASVIKAVLEHKLFERKYRCCIESYTATGYVEDNKTLNLITETKSASVNR